MSPGPPTSLSAVSQAAYQIVENILPQNILDGISRPGESSSEFEDVGNESPRDIMVLDEQTSPKTDLSASQYHDAQHIPGAKRADDPNPVAVEEKRLMESYQMQNANAQNDEAKIIEVLREEIKRHRNSSGQDCVFDKEAKSADAERTYLLQEEDIAQIVRRAIATLSGSQIALKDASAKSNAKENHRMSLPRPDSSKIQPIPAVTAEPATSISVPKTSYAMVDVTDKQVHTRTREPDMSGTTTIVSRKSIARITWAPETLQSVEDKQDDIYVDPLHQRRSILSMAAPQKPKSPLDQGSSSNPFLVDHSVTRKSDDKADENEQAPHEDELLMTSFPKLQSRHCTNEWLNPPLEVQKVVEVTDDDLYIQGIDAHCGNPSRNSVVVVVGDPPKPRHCDHSLFGENPFCKQEQCVINPQDVELLRPSVAEKRLGSSIGTSARRRRSSQVTQLRKNEEENKDPLLPGLMDKIRRSGRKIFHKHRSHKSSDQRSGEFATPYNSPDEQHQRSAVRSRDSIVRERTPEPAQVDQAGIYEALTGSRLFVPQQRRETCSEDNRPHVCEDDLLSTGGPSSLASPR